MDKKQKLDRCIKWRTSVSNKGQHGLYSQLMTAEEVMDAEKKLKEMQSFNPALAGNDRPLHTMSPMSLSAEQRTSPASLGTVPSFSDWLFRGLR